MIRLSLVVSLSLVSGCCCGGQCQEPSAPAHEARRLNPAVTNRIPAPAVFVLRDGTEVWAPDGGYLERLPNGDLRRVDAEGATLEVFATK